MGFSRLRGMQDSLGIESAMISKMETIARGVFYSFGFEEIRTPLMEERDLFKRALGTETDVVQKEMYEFEDRSKTIVALRPEGTAGIVRAYLENSLDKTEGLSRLFYMGPMFRSERPQAGRLRQFHQIGAEALGTDNPYADVEIIHCVTTFLERLGVSDYLVKLNNLGSFEERQDYKKVLKGYFEPKKNSLCDDCQARLLKNVFRILDCKKDACREVVRQSPTMESHLKQNSLEHFSTVCHGLEALGVAYQRDPWMVRGLDYYTKTVFEITHPKLGAQDALAAGGRYDHLVESFGGPKVGAVGFALGVERMLMCIEKDRLSLNETKTDFFMVALGEIAFKEAFRRLGRLRREGLRAGMDLGAKSMKSQMRSADKSHCAFVIILGDEELKKNQFILKHMKNGSQESHSLDEMLKVCRNVQKG